MAATHKKLISLFCGPGGFDEGFKQAGFDTRLAVDKDPISVETHKVNHQDAAAMVLDLTDQRAADILWEECQRRFPDEPPVGIIGGPPCQSFSVGNSHKKEDDPRHKLPRVYGYLIGKLNERLGGSLEFFVFENVPAIKDTIPYLDFKAQVRQHGFVVFEQELDAKYLGAPQVRKRLFIVGINQKKHPEYGEEPDTKQFEFPPQTGAVQACGPVLRAIRQEAVIANSNLTPEEVREVAGHWNHWCMEPKSNKFRNRIDEREHHGKTYRVALPDPEREQLLAKRMGGKSFKVLDETKPSYTVAYGHREVHLHPDQHRRLSVYEAMLLQGFPEHYRMLGTLTDQIRLVSEVVAPPVARALAVEIRRQLGLGASEQ